MQSNVTIFHPADISVRSDCESTRRKRVVSESLGSHSITTSTRRGGGGGRKSTNVKTETRDGDDAAQIRQYFNPIPGQNLFSAFAEAVQVMETDEKKKSKLCR